MGGLGRDGERMMGYDRGNMVGLREDDMAVMGG